jgi:transketolase
MDLKVSKDRCLAFRRRILDLSQMVSAMHIAPAFSCLEIVDTIYFGLMKTKYKDDCSDLFVLSKGHGCMAQYVVLEKMGILKSEELDSYCTPSGILGGHPDYGVPGIEASTGSLGHGLSIAVGMAYAEKLQGKDSKIYVVMGDGEMQEGSVWEAMMMAPNLGLDNLIAFIDLNDYQGLGRTSDIHPNFYPITDKCKAFGWEALEVDGHDQSDIFNAVSNRRGAGPTILICRTIKGKGVDFMIDSPIWHYRSPNKFEYENALSQLVG